MCNNMHPHKKTQADKHRWYERNTIYILKMSNTLSEHRKQDTTNINNTRQIAEPARPRRRPTGTRTEAALVIFPPTQSNQLSSANYPECRVRLEHGQCLKCFSQRFDPPEQHRDQWGDNWMSFSFASQDSLSPWHRIVELASRCLFPVALLVSFLVEFDKWCVTETLLGN